jgi:hypothetical protein
MKPARTTRLAKVDNPAFSTGKPESDANPRQVTAVVSLRESSIVSLAAHGVLDADQVAAAWRFRKAWEATRSIKPPALGFEERVQSGRPAGLPEKQLRAAETLRSCRELLGEHGYELVARICGDGFHIRDIYKSRRQIDTATDILRIHLTALGRLWH